MDDYLSEREQWEAFKRAVQEYAPSVLTAAAIVALGLGGYRWWQNHVSRVSLAAAARYERMEQAFARGDRTEAFMLVGDLERDYASTPYADQARLASARAFVQDGELGRGAAELRTVMRHSSDSALRLIARLRLARVQIAMHHPQAALVTLRGTHPGAFAALYEEAMGDADYALGRKAAALAHYERARAADAGASDEGLLELKIADLAANTPAAGARPAPK